MRELVNDFESLGDNCELGLVQRFYGAEPLALFRWVGINRLDQLIDALNARFAGLGEPGHVFHEMLPGWDHHAAIDTKYGFYFHTTLDPSAVLDRPDEVTKLAAIEGRRLKFLAGHLLNAMETGEKILVYRQKRALDEAEIQRLFDAVSRIGRNTLLVVIEDELRPPGSVEDKGNGLILAYVSRLSNENPPQVDLDAWRKILTDVHSLWCRKFSCALREGEMIERIMSVPVADLGTIEDPRFSGVLVPANEPWKIGPGVTTQFLDGAEAHHEKYFDIDYLRYLIDGAMDALAVQGRKDLILDIGSGSGPSVFALIDRFPRGHIVATDISPNLLAILRRALAERGKVDSCTTLCLDLNRRWFKDQSFDLAIGSAVLHHLFEPHRLIEEVFAALRPGAAVVFYEPFEPGYAMMALIYRTILAHASPVNPLDGALIDLFRGKIVHIGLMKCEPKDPTIYADIDDKWMFTREYFTEIGAKIGASRTIIYPINHSDRPFTNHMITMLRLGIGAVPSALPDWAWELIADIEASLSDSCKKDLLLEGCIAFVK